MTPHTTHFDDCGCLSARLKAENATLRTLLANLVGQINKCIPVWNGAIAMSAIHGSPIGPDDNIKEELEAAEAFLQRTDAGREEKKS